MNHQNLLGEFLRARRELLHPAEVGLPSGNRRRVPGLRREEVAALAGISAEYYLRLEQGRDRHPSEQVLEALARALHLDDESRTHARELARSRARRESPRPAGEEVPAGIKLLLSSLNAPAFVLNKYRDILAVNTLATRLEPSLQVGQNRLISLFIDPQARAYHPDWDANTASVVAQLRADIGADETDTKYQALVGELSMRSERFRQLWARYDIRVGGSAAGVINHPQLGDIHLHREKLGIVGTGLVLVIYHAQVGTRAARQIEELSRHSPADRDTTHRLS